MINPFAPQNTNQAYGLVPGFGYAQPNSNAAFGGVAPTLGLPGAAPSFGIPGMTDASGLSAEAMGPEAQIGGLLSALSQAFQPAMVDPVTMLTQQIAQTEQQLAMAEQSGDQEMVASLTQQLQELMAQLAQLTGQGTEGQDGGAAPMYGSADGGGGGGAAPAGYDAGGGGGGGGAAPSYGSGGGGGGGGGGGSSSSGGAGSASSSFPLDTSYSNSNATPGVEAMLKDAGSMVGLNERTDTAAIQKVTGKTGINPATTPWCAAFAMNMMRDHGVLDLDGLKNPNYCPEIKNWASGKNNYGKSGQYNPKPGDAILFDWQKDGTPDHIGIVEKVVNGKVYTIEGNSSDSVKRNSYPLNDGVIDGYVKSKDPKAAAPTTTAPKSTTTTPKSTTSTSKKTVAA